DTVKILQLTNLLLMQDSYQEEQASK
ncbi:MAG: hypothetical protein RLZ13_1425, partial [Bacteroidota bacterium]